MNTAWIAQRMRQIEASGIRKAFDLARSLTDPINLSIGLPDFDVPQPLKDAAIAAIREGSNAYTLTMGLPELRAGIQDQVAADLGHADRQVMVTSGTSGGLMLAICTCVEPGDEVIVFDPYFVMYNNLIALAGGTSVVVDTAPTYRVEAQRVDAAITGRTKCVIVNSPCNPTGVVANASELRAVAELCHERGILLISDEVYRLFTYDEPFASPARFNEDVLVVDGFSKTYGMTGWRLGYAHGPSALIQEMAKLQQFTFVCPPAPLQHGVVNALELDRGEQVATYRGKRDQMFAALKGSYRMPHPGGAFYAYLEVPRGYTSATQFAQEAVKHNLIVIPGSVFSRHDTHVRISYAVNDRTLDRGIEVLTRMAGGPAA